MAQTPRYMSGVGNVNRHRHVLRDNLEGISKLSLRRLARRGGVKRLSGLVYPVLRGTLYEYLQRIIQTAVIYTSHARRKTVTVYDIIYALKREGRALYGFGEITDLSAKCPRTRKRKPIRAKRSVRIADPPEIESQPQHQILDLGPIVGKENIDTTIEPVAAMDEDEMEGTQVDPDPLMDADAGTELDLIPDIDPEPEEKSSENWMDVRDINYRGKKTQSPRSTKKKQKTTPKKQKSKQKLMYSNL